VNETLLQRKNEFQRELLAWYRAHARDLPWRSQPSPYRTVVSEFMLQQTQVKTVLPYFDRWTERWPDFPALAAATEVEVLHAWEGLGYYSRARRLHALARELAARPNLPQTRDAWLTLPGIGPYTAAAIASIAGGEAVAVVDGNVVRILARLTANATAFRDSTTAVKAFAALAEGLLNPDHPGDHNQAMMELGATVCHRRKPLCTICPVRSHCAAARAGDPESYPQLAPKPIEQLALTRLWCERDGALLLHRAAAHARRLAGMHELPTPEHLGLDASAVAGAPVLTVKKRGITRFAITETIRRFTPPADAPAGTELVWVPWAQVPTLTLSGPHRRWITELHELARP
jgi:A/G-specific adenine glycosylase